MKVDVIASFLVVLVPDDADVASSVGGFRACQPQRAISFEDDSASRPHLPSVFAPRDPEPKAGAAHTAEVDLFTNARELLMIVRLHRPTQLFYG